MFYIMIGSTIYDWFYLFMFIDTISITTISQITNYYSIDLRGWKMVLVYLCY